MILWRPTGLEELQLIADADMRAFPPRLPGQPIFYPVLNEEYARQIAQRWNTKDSSHLGFVTRFEVDDQYVARFGREVVGSRVHEELWVPAEDLEEFNRHIVGRIEVVAVFLGDGWRDRVAGGSRASSLMSSLAERAEARDDAALALVMRRVAAEL